MVVGLALDFAGFNAVKMLVGDIERAARSGFGRAIHHLVLLRTRACFESEPGLRIVAQRRSYDGGKAQCLLLQLWNEPRIDDDSGGSSAP
jgi:hypothetical protein